MKSTKPGMIEQALRTAIAESGLSYQEISRRTGIPQPIISRFMRGWSLHLSTADRLAEFFNFQVIPGKPKPAKTVRRRK
jgi:predicted XRE-type DNA-binding protein